MNPEVIIEEINSRFGIGISQMRDNDRNMEIVKARHITLYFIRKYTGLSNRRIGEILWRDHATVNHACKSVQMQYETDKLYRHQIDVIDNTLRGYTEQTEDTCEVFMQNDFFTN